MNAIGKLGKRLFRCIVRLGGIAGWFYHVVGSLLGTSVMRMRGRGNSRLLGETGLLFSELFIGSDRRQSYSSQEIYAFAHSHIRTQNASCGDMRTSTFMFPGRQILRNMHLLSVDLTAAAAIESSRALPKLTTNR